MSVSCEFTHGDLEMRMLAQVSGDGQLQAAAAANLDLHGLAASKVFALDCLTDEVKIHYPNEREWIKAVDFYITQGQSLYHLAGQLRCTQAKAQGLRDDFADQFPAVLTFLSHVWESATRDGYIIDIFGARLFLPDRPVADPGELFDDPSLHAQDMLGWRRGATREAQHHVFRGAADHILQLATDCCHRQIQTHFHNVRLLLAQNDQLHFEVPDALIEEFIQELPQVMCGLGLNRYGFTVPLAVDVLVGPSWGEVSKTGSYTACRRR